ncbi:hypothetical protein [Microlunatus sp. GCM10028923]|uniref:hypothetical protein n=1 Tax=Microlunatus sp. GCM10028923 TaxID=3273400 RepID=UPI00361943F8
MAEASIGSLTTSPSATASHPFARHLVRAYLSTGVALVIFGIGYGLSLLDAVGCTSGGPACAGPRAFLLAGFLAAALAALVYAAYRTGLGLWWFMITAGLSGLVLASGVAGPLLVLMLLPVPGCAAAVTYLVRTWRRRRTA